MQLRGELPWITGSSVDVHTPTVEERRLAQSVEVLCLTVVRRSARGWQQMCITNRQRSFCCCVCFPVQMAASFAVNIASVFASPAAPSAGALVSGGDDTCPGTAPTRLTSSTNAKRRVADTAGNDAGADDEGAVTEVEDHNDAGDEMGGGAGAGATGTGRRSGTRRQSAGAGSGGRGAAAATALLSPEDSKQSANYPTPPAKAKGSGGKSSKKKGEQRVWYVTPAGADAFTDLDWAMLECRDMLLTCAASSDAATKKLQVVLDKLTRHAAYADRFVPWVEDRLERLQQGDGGAAVADQEPLQRFLNQLRSEQAWYTRMLKQVCMGDLQRVVIPSIDICYSMDQRLKVLASQLYADFEADTGSDRGAGATATGGAPAGGATSGAGAVGFDAPSSSAAAVHGAGDATAAGTAASAFVKKRLSHEGAVGCGDAVVDANAAGHTSTGGGKRETMPIAAPVQAESPPTSTLASPSPAASASSSASATGLPTLASIKQLLVQAEQVAVTLFERVSAAEARKAEADERLREAVVHARRAEEVACAKHDAASAAGQLARDVAALAEEINASHERGRQLAQSLTVAAPSAFHGIVSELNSTSQRLRELQQKLSARCGCPFTTVEQMLLDVQAAAATAADDADDARRRAAQQALDVGQLTMVARAADTALDVVQKERETLLDWLRVAPSSMSGASSGRSLRDRDGGP